MSTAGMPFQRRRPLALLVLFLLPLLAYIPAIASGGFIWDDPDYVTHNPLLRTPEGLLTIWTSPSSLPQYYPLVHTTYWVEYHLVGLRPQLYHLDNVLLHAASAVLLYLLLRRIAVPGAWLAAAVFAVHPVMVESVAWVTERKNTLSLFLYLCAFLAYWRFATPPAGGAPPAARGRRWTWYAAAVAFFLCAMLSKTVACTFPAAVLLVLWWKRPHDVKRHLIPLLPFFAIGLSLGLYTAHLERTHVGATGAEFNFSHADRLLIASSATTFYVGKLALPYPLSFIYPRWHLAPSDPVQWVPLLLDAALTAALAFAAFRRRTPGPLVAWLLFVGTLFPALGFFNVYPMRYSFVADHFQYHASVAMVALFAAALAYLGHRLPRPARIPLATVLVLTLAAVTFARTRVYESALTLWTDTAAKNPDSWMVHVNLGHALVNEGDLDAAQQNYERAAALAPEQPEALINVGGMLAKRGHYDAAIAEYNRALAVRPDYPPALFGIGSALLFKGDPAAARPWLERAVAADPEYAQAQYHLGLALEKLNDPEGARRAYAAAVAADPEDVDSLYNLGTLYLNYHHPGDAAECFRRAVALRPDRANYRANLAAALWQLGDRDGAIAEYAAAARLDPVLGAGIRQFLAQRGIALPE
jgi:tetratricopeptide (TPR) repeat protein